MAKFKTTITAQSSIYYILFAIFFLLAFLERTVFDLGPNIELLTSAMVLSAFALGRKWTFWLTFSVIALSDRIIGNSKILLFTWSGFLIPVLLASRLVNYLNLKFKLRLVGLAVTGLSINFFFFLWTNFGVWLLDSWGMYTKNLQGLIICYIMGLPFLKNEVVSSLIFIPLGYFVIRLSEQFAQKISFTKNSNLEEKVLK